MISQFFILSARGDTLIVRDFRHDLIRNTPEIFYRHVKQAGDEKKPIFNKDGINFFYQQRPSLYLVCTSRFNCQPGLPLDLLNRVAAMIKDLCGVLTEEAIRKNFVQIYELIDEMVDFGYPQITGTSEQSKLIVSEPIPCEGVKIPARNILNSNTISSEVTKTSVTKVTNNIYVDVIENISVTFNTSGFVVNSALDGSIKMKSYLGGNPSLKLSLNSDVNTGDYNSNYGINLEDVAFDICVDSRDFDSQKLLSITPNLGEFIAMNYRITKEFMYPFRIYPFLTEINNYKIELLIKIKSTFGKDINSSKFKVSFSVPESVSSVKPEQAEKIQGQKTEYVEKNKCVDWEIEKFKGETEHSLNTKITLKEELNSFQIRKEIGPIKVEFEINQYSVSSQFIKYLRVENYDSKKAPQRWIRYIATSNSYICRV